MALPEKGDGKTIGIDFFIVVPCAAAVNGHLPQPSGRGAAGGIFRACAASLRVTVRIKSTDITPDFCPCSRRISGRNLFGCNR